MLKWLLVEEAHDMSTMRLDKLMDFTNLWDQHEVREERKAIGSSS